MRSILIVDDEPQILKLLTQILETAGYETMTAPDGKIGLRTFMDRHPDLIIMDMVMPEKEGLETIIELKRIDPEVKIIAISGGGWAEPDSYLSMAKKLGAKEVIAKPIIMDELLEKVKSLFPEN